MALSSSVPLSKSLHANESIRIRKLPIYQPFSNIQFPIFQNLSNKPLTDKFIGRRSSSTTKTKVSFFPAFLTKGKDAKSLKVELLEAIIPLDRGADATPEDQQSIDQLIRKLEAENPTKEPLKSDLLNGKWELLYTTSQSILQTQRPKFLNSRVNYQAINADTLRVQNMETWPFFNQVTADLTPVNSRKVAVKFDYFKIGGLIPVKTPDSARGSLEITYLDEDLRKINHSCTSSRSRDTSNRAAILEKQHWRKSPKDIKRKQRKLVHLENG